MKNTVKFTVDVKGEISGRQFQGVFETKVKLSHREALKEDEVRRTILGTNPGDASEFARQLAGALAYLAVRIIDAPTWWRQSNNGLDLEDSNVLVAVNNACIGAVGDEIEAHLKAAESAAVELKKSTE